MRYLLCKKPVLIGIALMVALLVIVGPPAWRFLSWREDYGEAEPLVETIGRLAEVLTDYQKQHGRGPATLEEVRSFAPEFDASRLEPYHMTFQPAGTQRFFIRVNRRFAFEIDDRNIPSWAEFTAVERAASK